MGTKLVAVILSCSPILRGIEMILPLPVPTQRRLHDNSSDVTRDNTFLSVAVIPEYNNIIEQRRLLSTAGINMGSSSNPSVTQNWTIINFYNFKAL